MVIHLVKLSSLWWVDRRLALALVVAGFVLVLGSAVRDALTGSEQLLIGVLIAAAVNSVWLLHRYLRLWKATVFIKGGRVGTTNWLGLSRSIPVESVDHFHRTAERLLGGKPRAVLFIVRKDRRDSLRFAGGDCLEPGGIERIAARIGVSIRGSWSELPTWRPQ